MLSPYANKSNATMSCSIKSSAFTFLPVILCKTTYCEKWRDNVKGRAVLVLFFTQNILHEKTECIFLLTLKENHWILLILTWKLFQNDQIITLTWTGCGHSPSLSVLFNVSYKKASREQGSSPWHVVLGFSEILQGWNTTNSTLSQHPRTLPTFCGVQKCISCRRACQQTQQWR